MCSHNFNYLIFNNLVCADLVFNYLIAQYLCLNCQVAFFNGYIAETVGTAET